MKERIVVLCNNEHVAITRRAVRDQHESSGTGTVHYMGDEYAALCIDGQWTIDVCARKQHAWDEVLRVRREHGYPDYGPNMDTSYGYPNVDNPLDFSPDPECATAQELEAWVDAVKRFEAGEDYENLQPFTITDDDGNFHMHISRTSWGLGVNFYRPSSLPATQISGYWLDNVAVTDPSSPPCPACNDTQEHCPVCPPADDAQWLRAWRAGAFDDELEGFAEADFYTLTERVMSGE